MNVEPRRSYPSAKSAKLRRRLISAVWFVAIMGTVGLAGANPLLGFPVALGLIFLSIIFPGENPCGVGELGGPNE